MSVIGITFGNTTSSIAVAADGKVDVIANPDGDRAIPSALSYVGSDEYHGSQALSRLIRNPENTIVNFRDFVGKSFLISMMSFHMVLNQRTLMGKLDTKLL